MKLSEIIKQPEGRKLDFKQSVPNRSDLAKTAVAFANDAGGVIYIGVKDDPRTIVGLPEEELIKIEEQLMNMILDNCAPTVMPDVTFLQSDGKCVIKLSVHKGSNPPYYLKRKGMSEGVYIRAGSVSKQASPEMIAELIRRRQNISFDSELVYLKKANEINISSFSKSFQETAKEELTQSVLLKLELIRSEQGKMLPTNALILLSDDELKNRLFPNAIISCARFKGDDVSIFIDQKTIDSDIITQSDEAFNFVKRHISQRTTGYVGVYRKDRWEYPISAIREAIRNAVIHRDYTLSGQDIKLAIFDNRIEITSPGRLLPSIDYNDMEAGQSEIRNKTLAPVFKKLGIIEKWGNGLRLISNELKTYSDIGLRWIEPGVSFKVIFYQKNYMVKKNSYYHEETTMKVEDSPHTIETGYRTTIEKKDFSIPLKQSTLKTADKIIQLLKLNPKLSNSKLAEIIGDITLDGINYHLKKLSKQGKIKHAGPAKGGYWIVLE